jgi:hypothetical protein
MLRNKVLFPEPFAPQITVIFPGAMETLTAAKADALSKRTDRSVTRIIASSILSDPLNAASIAGGNKQHGGSRQGG